MNIEQYVTYSVVISVLLLSPGPSVLLSINNGLNHGKKLAAYGILGNVIAFQLLLIFSATGLGAVILTFNELLIFIKIFGAGYLCYLGVKIYRSTIPQLNTGCSLSSLNHQPWQVFKQAFWVTSLNPKALVFVSALLPQFIAPTEPLMSQVTLLSLVSALIHFSIYFGYAALAAKMKRVLNNKKGRRLFNKLSGIVFLVFGLFLGLSDSIN